MELRNYIRILAKGWWLIVPAFIIAVVTGLVLTFSQPSIYRTSATFVVSPSKSLGEFNEFMRSLDSLSRRDGAMATYVEIANSNTILDSVFKDMGLTEDRVKRMRFNAQLIPSTNIIKVTVESDSPELARIAANTVGQKTIEYVGTLYEAYDMKPLDTAITPEMPAKPDRVKNLVLAAILGLSVGVGAAFVLEYLRLSKDSVAHMSIIDGDTGVYNSYYFMQRLGEEISRANRHGYPLSLGLMNIERLDITVDKRLPHLRNEALRQVGFFLKRNVREEDLVARIDGTRFAILLPDTYGLDAKQILEELQSRLEWNIFELEQRGLKLNLAATSGVAGYTLNGGGRDELVSKAEIALLRADENGYNGICLYDDSKENEAVIDERDGD